MKCHLFVFYFLSNIATFYGQVIRKGDVIFNANIGYPNIQMWDKQRTAEKEDDAETWGKVDGYWGHEFQNTKRSTSLRADYAVLNNLTIGVVMSYWAMDFSYKANYVIRFPGNSYKTIVDSKYHMSDFGMGLKANHFFFIRKNFGWNLDLGLGISNRKLSVQEYAGNKTEPEYSSRLAAYLSATMGVKYYPLNFKLCSLGFNLECGYDHGSLFLAGLAFKFHTKKTSDNSKNENN